jgi:hypothetical protein
MLDDQQCHAFTPGNDQVRNARPAPDIDAADAPGIRHHGGLVHQDRRGRVIEGCRLADHGRPAVNLPGGEYGRHFRIQAAPLRLLLIFPA